MSNYLGLNRYIVEAMIKNGKNIHYNAFTKEDLIYMLRICREMYFELLNRK